MSKTPEQLAEQYATSIAGGPLHDQSWHYVKRDYLAGYKRAIEDAAKLCMDSAEGSRVLQIACSKDNDPQGALVHLSDKLTAVELSRSIRALAERSDDGKE